MIKIVCLVIVQQYTQMQKHHTNGRPPKLCCSTAGIDDASQKNLTQKNVKHNIIEAENGT